MTTARRKLPPTALAKLAALAKEVETLDAKLTTARDKRDNMLADLYDRYDVDMPTLADVAGVKKQWVHRVVNRARATTS